MNTMFKKIATGTAALALMTTVFASGALAAETANVGATIDGAETITLSQINAVGTFGTINLTGATQTIGGPALGSFGIVDARGTGSGWNVSIKASSFSNPNAPITSLSPGTFSLSAPELTDTDGNSSAAADINVTGGQIDALDGAGATLTAETGEGMGSYTVAGMNMTLTLMPKEVYEGTYSSTVTVTLAAGPGTETVTSPQ